VRLLPWRGFKKDWCACLSAVSKLCPNGICWSYLGWLSSEEQIPQIVVNVRNRRKTMEPLELTILPWAQGVGRSNRPAPTNRINSLWARFHGPENSL